MVVFFVRNLIHVRFIVGFSQEASQSDCCVYKLTSNIDKVSDGAGVRLVLLIYEQVLQDILFFHDTPKHLLRVDLRNLYTG